MIDAILLAKYCHNSGLGGEKETALQEKQVNK